MSERQEQQPCERLGQDGREPISPSERKTYCSPVLTCYGTVASLTKGSLTVGADAGPLFFATHV